MSYHGVHGHRDVDESWGSSFFLGFRGGGGEVTHQKSFKTGRLEKQFPKSEETMG